MHAHRVLRALCLFRLERAVLVLRVPSRCSYLVASDVRSTHSLPVEMRLVSPVDLVRSLQWDLRLALHVLRELWPIQRLPLAQLVLRVLRRVHHQ